MIPGTRGGTNWGGGAFDASTNMLYIMSLDAPDIQTIIKQEPEVVDSSPDSTRGIRFS
jgi:quinoprotein glucose dehydrogenase